MSTSTPFTIPTTALPLLPLLQGVIFPHTVTTIPVGRDKSVALIQDTQPGQLVIIAVQRDPEVSDPGLDDLYPIATLARVQQLVRLTGGNFRVVLQGVARARLTALTQQRPYWLARVEEAPELGLDEPESHARASILHEQVKELTARTGGSLARALRGELEPGELADRVAAELGLDTAHRAEVLGALHIPTRLALVTDQLSEQAARSEIKTRIEDEVRRGLGKNQRDAILREQLRAIRKELGDEGGGVDDTDRLRERLEAADLPDDVRQVAQRELGRLEAMSPQQAEANVIRTYLEWIIELPWRTSAKSDLELDAIQTALDAEHHGLEDVKQHILEHMAVLKLSGNTRGTILCLAGPPGVGKTSLAQSVADAIGRPLVRLSLGGVRDEAEIRGHRRTYVGAMPGRLINAMRKAGVNNPVMVLDEIDKLGQGWMGSPEAALLEVLDPEQNANFTDHYMELPYDLSNVMFICTANDLQNISAPLRDRLEIIDVTGYTPHDKVQIAQQHLLPQQRAEHGLKEEDLTMSDAAMSALILDYTREAGVRQLKRQLIKICRAVTLEKARTGAVTHRLEPLDLDKYLGKARFFSEIAARTAIPGVATGLAWTPTGGDILFIETTRMPGQGRVETTGQLGDVMKESARAALAYVRTHAEELGVEPSFLTTQDLHIHFPAGGVPKDGPSAGVTIFTALTSLLTGKRVRPDTAMTGECSLRGRVLPVGGIKAKVLAAHRAGIKRIILPAQNARDLDDVPQSALDELEIILAEDMREVLAAALDHDDEAAQVSPDATTPTAAQAPHMA